MSNGLGNLPVGQHLEQSQKRLEEFEKSVGLNVSSPIEVENETKRLLQIKPAELSKLNSIECGEAAFTLKQFAFYLQRALNVEQGKQKWAEEKVRRITAKRVPEYKGYSFEERLAQAVVDDDAALAADNERTQAKLRISRLWDLANRVSDMAKSLESLQHTKKRRNESD